MALNLITLDEAARLLGLEPEAVGELRESGKLHGYRDGASWKFKRQDVERLAEERRSGGGDLDSEDSIDLDFGGLSDDDDADAVLLSERELGPTGPSTSSTVIGKPGTYNPDESDIRIVTEEDRARRAASGSDVKLVPQDEGTPGSDVSLVPRSGDSREVASVDDAMRGGGGSDIRLADDEPSGPGLDFGSDVSLGADVMDVDLDDDSLFDEAPAASKGGRQASDSQIDLDADSGEYSIRTGRSDVTRGAADSGISLASPADSGISLEEPVELSGVSEEPFELGEDPLLAMGSDSDSNEVGSMASDDEFLLTPMEEAKDSESDDSGSQVIALDSAADFADSPGGLLAVDDMGASGDFGDVDLGSASLAGGPALAAAPVAVPLGGRESAFTALQVTSLGICWMLLAVSGMMAYDLLRNMWAWQGPYSVNSPLIDFLSGLF